MNPDFDPIARPYRWLEYLTFGPALQRCRTHFLPRLLERRHALVFGDGDGRFLAELLAANNNLDVDAVDISATMLSLLERRALSADPEARGRLRTHVMNALGFTPQRTYDLVVTHFFLDCLAQPELNVLCHCLTPHLSPGALWVVSDFHIPAGFMRWPARALVRSLYLGFRILTGLRTRRLPDHAAALSAVGFHRIAQHHSLGGILSTELWRFDANFANPEEYTSSMLPPQHPSSHSVEDPVPDPEPASPSLPEPDPGVFHHEPGTTPPAESEVRSRSGE